MVLDSMSFGSFRESSTESRRIRLQVFSRSGMWSEVWEPEGGKCLHP